MNTTSLEASIIKKRYKVIKTLGTGGMGTVYLAEDLEQGNIQVSIKEMHKISDPVERAKDIGQFGKEAKFLTRLSHPNLPKLYEFFFENDRPYLVMEYIEGKTLDHILEESTGPIKENLVLEWAIQICDVLYYLHTQAPHPIIFRDLKLSNIMLDREGRIKLVDFGIAREFNPRKDTDTIRMGSVGYAPMEQYAKGGQTDVRTDIYALGVCLHTLLTKNDPATTPFSFQDICKYNSGISPCLNNLIMKALEIKPENRFQTVAELLAKLKEELPLPFIKITPDFIDLGEIMAGEKKKASVIITNSRKGLLSGKLESPLSEGIKLNLTGFKNNYQELIIEVNSLEFEPDKEYLKRVTFLSNGGEAHIELAFKVVFSKTRLDLDVSFLDFGTLKYEKETSQEFTLYNTGGGLIHGKISSPQEWLTFTPNTFNSNEEKIKVTVEEEKLPEGSVHNGIINIESNGGNININAIVFRPVLGITPSEIDLKVVSSGEIKHIPLKIINRGKGFLKSKIYCDSPYVRLSSDVLKGNNNYITVSVDTGKLKKGRKHRTLIEIDGNGGKLSVPVVVEPYSPVKTIFRCLFILFLALLIIVSNHFRYTADQITGYKFLSRLSAIPSKIAYFTEINGHGKIYIVNPDGTDKTFIARGYLPRWSPDGKKIIFSTTEGQMHLLDMRTGKNEILAEGTNPVWSPDGKKIVFEKDSDVIMVMDLSTGKSVPLIYGQFPSWSPGGVRLVYSDKTSDGSSIKMVSIKDSIPEVLGSGFNPLWSHNGSHIVYNSDKKTLCITQADKLSTEKTFEGEDPAWSFSDIKLAFQKDGTIYIFDLKKGEQKQIIYGYEPSWSPDDNYLAFSSGDGIYVIEISTGMTYQIASEGYSPVWSRR